MSDFFDKYKIHPRDCLLEVRLQKGSEEHELKLFCPCPTTALFAGIDEHCKCPTHRAWIDPTYDAVVRPTFQRDFETSGLAVIISIFTRKYWVHQYTLNTKKAIYITFRAEYRLQMPILATMTITPRDRTFEFDYTGTVPYDVIDKMERTCLLLQGLKGMPLKVKYNVDEASFLACEALYDMLHWGTTEATTTSSSITTSSTTTTPIPTPSPNARNVDEEEPELNEEPREEPRQEPRQELRADM